MSIINGLADPIFVKDVEGRYVLLNDSCAGVLGIDAAGVVGRTDDDLLPPEEVIHQREADRAVMSERTARTEQARLTTNGRSKTFLATRYPWISARGDVLGVIGIVREVTAPRTADASERAAAARFHLLADAAPVLLWTADADGRLDFFNASWLRFTGVPQDEQFGMGWLAQVHPEDRAELTALHRRSFRECRAFRAEYRLRRNDGVYHWILSAAAPLIDSEGGLLAFVGSGTDIHETVLEHYAVEESAAELEKLTADLEVTVGQLRRRTQEAEAARDRAVLTERQAQFLDEASRVLQTSLDPRATLQSVADLAVPDIADRCTVHLLDGPVMRIETASTPEVSALDELARRYPGWARIGPVRVARTGASELYPEITPDVLTTAAADREHLRLLQASGIRSAMVVPLKAHDRILGTLTLLSVQSGRHFGLEDLRLAEELARRAAIAVDNAHLYRRLEDASRAKSEFLATMSHELRTPLNAISEYTDLLQLGVSDEKNRRQHLERIKASTWQLLSMIEEILSFSRLESGAATVHTEVVEAQELVREAAGLLEPAIRQKHLELRLLLPGRPLVLESDRLKIRQILMNLLSNAVKFTQSGVVTVNVVAEPPHAVFHVSDTGLGIREEQLDRIFEPFWQADAGRTRRTGGTGIGLAVAWRLAELLGGRLDVASTYGKGSTFTLRIPLDASHG